MNALDEEKKFYERFWALLGNRNLMRVFEALGPEAFRRSSVLEGFEKFLDANDVKGDVCVEIGTLNGLTAALLARRFRRVITVDIVEGPHRRAVANLLNLHNVEFVVVADNAEKAKVIDRIPTFDFAYVDGNHHDDTQSDFALVRRCGRVLFHEHWDAQPAVVNLVGSLIGRIVTDGKFALWTA